MFNKTYNTRNSGRYNNAAQFESPAAVEQQHIQQQPPSTPRRQCVQQNNLLEVPLVKAVDDDEEMIECQDGDDGLSVKQEDRPAWMKNRLTGVKKISNKERRRRQNETLRRLLTPKNGLMVLNEMMPNEQIANHFTVEAAQNQFYSRNSHTFCAALSLEGQNYKGYGDNKLSARNSAAEQAIRDLIIKKMHKKQGAVENSTAPAGGGEEPDEDALPMIQLASFALHKLFSEWEYDGHKVPQLRPTAASLAAAAAAAAGAAGSVPGAPEQVASIPMPDTPEVEAPPRTKKTKGGSKKPRTMPVNAPAMHPCMLLAYMRPRLDYRELAVQGDKPQNMLFTMGVDVDGSTYVGKAANKKEARKAAARAACVALFDTKFDENATATMPLH